MDDDEADLRQVIARLRQENAELRARLQEITMSGADRESPAERLALGAGERAASMLPAVRIPDEGINFTSVVSTLERELILRCLEKTGGNKRRAARLLQLSRTTLIDKLHRLNPGEREPAA